MSLCVTLAKDNFSSFEGEVNERAILHSFDQWGSYIKNVAKFHIMFILPQE